jgi:hypothetical protein
MAVIVAGGIGLITAGTAHGTTYLSDYSEGAPFLQIDKRVMVPGWKIRGRKRVIAVMVGRTTERDPAGNLVEGVPTEMDGAVKVVCAGRRGGVAQRTVRFQAEGDGQNASIIRLPGYINGGCAFRFVVEAAWYDNGNTLVEQFIGARIESG